MSPSLSVFVPSVNAPPLTSTKLKSSAVSPFQPYLIIGVYKPFKSIMKAETTEVPLSNKSTLRTEVSGVALVVMMIKLAPVKSAPVEEMLCWYNFLPMSATLIEFVPSVKLRDKYKSCHLAELLPKSTVPSGQKLYFT